MAAKRGPKPKPAPTAELGVVTELTNELAALEEQARQVRERRNQAVAHARRAGATVAALAQAANMNTRSMDDILRATAEKPQPPTGNDPPSPS